MSRAPFHRLSANARRVAPTRPVAAQPQAARAQQHGDAAAVATHRHARSSACHA